MAESNNIPASEEQGLGEWVKEKVVGLAQQAVSWAIGKREEAEKMQARSETSGSPGVGFSAELGEREQIKHGTEKATSSPAAESVNPLSGKSAGEGGASVGAVNKATTPASAQLGPTVLADPQLNSPMAAEAELNRLKDELGRSRRDKEAKGEVVEAEKLLPQIAFSGQITPEVREIVAGALDNARQALNSEKMRGALGKEGRILASYSEGYSLNHVNDGRSGRLGAQDSPGAARQQERAPAMAMS